MHSLKYLKDWSYKLTLHLETHQLINTNLASKNTDPQSMHFYINTISTALNENKYCIGLFLDFKKAFDTVPHEILLKKLGKIGNRWHLTGLLAISQIELKV
jgi:hypothetical protein